MNQLRAPFLLTKRIFIRRVQIVKQAIRPRPMSASRALVPAAIRERLEESLRLVGIDAAALAAAHARRDAHGVLAAVHLGLGEESLYHAVQLLLLSQIEVAARAAMREAVSGVRTAKGAVEKADPIVGIFDLANPRAIEYARRESGQLVTAITAQTRETLRVMVSQAFRQGVTVDELARQIREVVGLLPRQATALANFKSRLTGEGVTGLRIQELADPYRRRLLTQSARTIARTEIIGSSSFGQNEAWRQAVEAGWLRSGAKRKWIVTADDKLCPRCEPMRGKTATLGRSYDTGEMGPPKHPNCRCTQGLALLNEE